MSVNYILSQYIDEAMSQAVYDKLEDGSFVGRIPSCKGVIAFASTLRQCENELRSTLEDWILLGLKLGHALPVINNIDLNEEPIRELGGHPVSVGILSKSCGDWDLTDLSLAPDISLWSSMTIA